MPSFKLAIDTGGTHTDFCLLSASGELHIYKEPSTPEEPAKAVIAGINGLLAKTGADPAHIDLILLGTTVATNAILEHKGAATVLLTTKGFQDILYIGRQNRPHIYDFHRLKPPPLIPRRHILEVDERILADGTVHTALSDAEILRLLQQVEASGVTSVAVCLLHSYANPAHEQRLKEALLQRFPGLTVTISAEILPEFREYERTSTTVIDAYVKPLVEQHIALLQKEIAAIGVKGELFIMHSGGGVLTTTAARRHCAQIALSESAGSALAGVSIANATPHRNLLTADMGGTSMDICLIEQGKVRFTTEGNISGYPLSLPMLDTVDIGAGGSSIAWVDAGGALQVGPRSAGAANPGPACYDLGGTEPTVTDANVVLGRLAPEDLNVHPALKPDLAARAISLKICAPLGISLEEAAEGIIRIVNARMVRAMRRASIERGYDPRLFTFVPFGSACPLHAVELAAEMKIPRILITPHPGVASAWGMLSADVRHYYSQTCLLDFVPEAHQQINQKYDQLTAQAREMLHREGFTDQATSFIRMLDLRYQGQPYELTLVISANTLLPADLNLIARRFHREHQKRYGYERPSAPLESVTLRLMAMGALPKEIQPAPASVAAKELKPLHTREIYLSGAYRTVPVFARSACGLGAALKGPAVITQEDATTLIWPGNRVTCDRWGNLLIIREDEHL